MPTKFFKQITFEPAIAKTPFGLCNSGCLDHTIDDEETILTTIPGQLHHIHFMVDGLLLRIQSFTGVN